MIYQHIKIFIRDCRALLIVLNNEDFIHGTSLVVSQIYHKKKISESYESYEELCNLITVLREYLGQNLATTVACKTL